MIQETNMSRLWYRLYTTLINKGEHVPSRIGNTRHLTDYTFCLHDPRQCIIYSSVRKLSAKYMLAELQWYFSGSNLVSDIGKYAKMWNTLTDDGTTVNSAYGYRIFKQFGFNQLQFVVDKLKQDIHSRQAVIHIKDASDKPTKDTPCTCLIQFVVFRGRLNAHTYMRSNDIWFGTPYDVIFFCILQQIVAKAVGLPLGSYYHTVGDLHVYEKNIKPYSKDSVMEGPGFEYDEKETFLHLMESPDNSFKDIVNRLEEIKNAQKDKN